MKIGVFGAGYVGLTTAACLANLGHKVVCMDINEGRIKRLQEGEMPFYEPKLPNLIKKNTQRGTLQFTTDPEKVVEFGQVLFNCVGTPSNDDGSADLRYVFEVAETVAKYAQEKKFFVVKSTVPPGTAAQCYDKIRKVSNSAAIEVISNPELLREGQAIDSFNYPDKIVVGAHSDEAFRAIKRVYSGRLRIHLPIVETDWETAELIKYANNTFLATKISFINEMANICDKLGADVKMVARALGMDYRIAPKFLNPGVGYGGSCFPKDVRAIVHSARQENYIPKLFEEVIAVNERQKNVIVQKIESVYGPDLTGKTFAILGLSFKPHTSDMREAPSLHVVPELLKRGAKLRVFDPKAMGEAKEYFNDGIVYCDSPEHATEGSDAFVVLTEWDDFRSLDLLSVKESMKGHTIFDGRNIYEPELVKEDGFVYHGVGRQ